MRNGGPLNSPALACQKTTEPTTTRISNNAMPGGPPANVEYSRRNTYLDTIIWWSRCDREPRQGGGIDSLGSSGWG